MNENPPHVLVIDDDASVLGMVTEALTHYGMKVHPYSQGTLAMRALEDPNSPPFDLVVSDINMDGMDGFDVIHRVKTIQANLPVVLMTGAASLDYAIRAMRMGAANLFQKPLTLRELVKSVFHLVELHREFRLAQDGLKGLVEETRHFTFKSSELDIPSVVKNLTDRLIPLGFATPGNLDVLAMAIHESLVNALEHGNLELDSNLKGDLFAVEDSYAVARKQRLSDPQYCDRLVDVKAFISPDSYRLEITDGGPGFDTSKLMAQTTDETLTRQCGRGLPLIHMVMDEVAFNETGNQIRMLLKKKDA